MIPSVDTGDFTPDDAVEDDYPPDLTEEEEAQAPQPRAAGIRAKAMGRGMKPVFKPAKVSKNSKRVLAMEKQRKALELRKGGASYASIAQAVGYKDQSGARKAVQRAFRDVIQEPALEVKTIQIERLNHMLLTLWPKVQQGDENAINTSLRVMDKIDRLMGTEEAQKVSVDVHTQNAVLVIDGDKDDYIAAMKRMAGIVDNTSGHNIPQQIDSQPYPQPVDDVVDAEVIEGSLADELGAEGRQAVVDLMMPPVPEKPTKKSFNFGMDPRRNS